ncbi:hypothetical protein [Roseospira navarrensis]|uniref:Uncharacterized protein n=1 Tax=Roseospira navarrensis TaxID=140058 RepID=A0A7X1ZGF0_9PROT|nr:hypothetical protein [Roseospira navarrensis]MQX38000.1 hypothetical protein [Roseospira navarrensis]
MKVGIVLAVMLAMGPVMAGGAARAAADAAGPEASEPAVAGLAAFDGTWQTPDGRWRLRIENGTATILAGGDGRRPVGSEILRLTAVDGSTARGTYRFSNGGWGSVTASVAGGALRLSSGATSWAWQRVAASPVAEPASAAPAGQAAPSSTPAAPPAGAWGADPAVRETLARVMRDHPATDAYRECRQAHGPLDAATAMVLLEGTRLTVERHGRTVERLVTSGMIQPDRVCLDSPIQCGQLYYCASDEALFFVRRDLIVAVNPVGEVAAVQAHLTDPVAPEGPPWVSVVDQPCQVVRAWPGTDRVVWTGACARGKATGPGVLTWMQGPSVLGRTRVGPDWALHLDEGVLKLDLDLSAFRFSLSACGMQGDYRHVQVLAPEGMPPAVFEGPWVVDRLMTRAAAYATTLCPIPDRGVNNIAVSIATAERPDQPLVTGRNYERDALTWREFRNAPAAAAERAIQQEERARVQQAQREAAQARERQLMDLYRALRADLVNQARSFLSTGEANLPMLAAALDEDELGVLDRLERGAWLRLEPASGVQTVEHEGDRHYAATYAVGSPFARLEADMRSQRDFSWENWFDQTQATPPRRTTLTCLFEDTDAIPRESRLVEVRLLDFSSAGQRTTIRLLCE